MEKVAMVKLTHINDLELLDFEIERAQSLIQLLFEENDEALTYLMDRKEEWRAFASCERAPITEALLSALSQKIIEIKKTITDIQKEVYFE